MLQRIEMQSVKGSLNCFDIPDLKRIDERWNDDGRPLLIPSNDPIETSLRSTTVSFDLGDSTASRLRTDLSLTARRP